MRLSCWTALWFVHVVIPIHGFPRSDDAQSTKVIPVILVPGDGGSQFEAKLNKTSVPHFFCEKKTNDFFDLWLNLEQMVPYVIDCWVDNMRLIYDAGSGVSYNTPGVTIRIPGFGNTTTVEYLDPSKLSVATYFAPIVNALVSSGYKRGVSIRGAPYDFRKATDEQAEYFVNMKRLVEETYSFNGNQKVALVAHSMGNPYSLYFLNRQSQPWKDKYIHSLIGLAGVWGGSVKPWRVFASGDNLDIWALSALKLRKGQRTYPSLSYLMPQLPFWNKTDVFVQTPTANYSLSNVKQFFTDIRWPVGYKMWQKTGSLLSALKAPGVPVHCLHGSGVKTAERFIYGAGQFPNSVPQSVFGDGDGTVNIRSLLGCLRWKKSQVQAVAEKSFAGVDHMDILSDHGVIAYLKSVLIGPRARDQW